MTYLVAFIILTRCLLVQGNLEWKVLKKITEYGQNVTLVCNVSNCCPKSAGWDKYTPQQRTIIIDVKTWRPTKKYDGNILTDGYTLVIQNLTKQDINISYSCVYGSSLGDQQYLLEDNVFDYISTTHQNSPIDNRTIFAGDISTTQQKGQIGNHTFSAGTIAGIILGVSAAVLVAIFIICFWKRRKERHNSTRNSIEGSSEEVPLINPFLEEPDDIQCIDGDDAILTCKLSSDIPQVKWLKNGKEIIQSLKCIMSTADAEHTLTLKNTTQNDSGDYYVHVGQFSHKIQLTITEPSMAVNMDEKNTYMDAIKTGIEVRQYVRIQVIGKDRVGKTSLVRRLLFLEDGSYDGKSTDGIEVDRKCQIRRKDGQWFVGDVETEKKERIKRIHLAVNTKQNKSISKLSQLPTEEYVSDLEKKKMEQKQNATSEYFEIEETHNFQDTLISDDNVIEKEPFDVLSKINDDTQHASITLAASTSDGKQSSIPDKMEKQQNNDLKNHELVPNSSDQITEMMVSKMDEILAYAKIEKDKMKSEGLVECGIWDFAGQKDYYATHQTFFTPNAIYLLVADIEDDIKPITHNEDDCNCIGDYIDFWFDSVHCFCKDRSAMKLCPPVVMVCTGTDKFEKVEDRKKEYEANIRQVFGKQKKSDHRRGIYFISNTNFRAEDKKEIKRLRKHISDIALEMNYFAEKLPTKWIQLENALEVLKDLSIYVYSWDNLLKLSHENMIEEEELLAFLIYQHKIGNIIFFNDIRDYIILRPDWLVKCFRCLICDCNIEKRNYNLICPTSWNELKNSGELSEILINQLFQKEPELKFADHKTHLLNVMEKFDIVIKPQFKDTSTDKCQKSSSYYLPCMIEKSSSYKSVMERFIKNTSDVTITPWLVFEFEFLPLAYFNHILFHYIRNYEVCEIKTKMVEQKAIYRGKAVFSLDDLRIFIICFSHNAISVQIWEWGNIKDNVYKTVLNELGSNIEILQEKLRQTLTYTIKAKCFDGDHSTSEGRITLDISSEKEIYRCKEHMNTHSMDNIKKTWLKHALEFEIRRRLLLEFDALKYSNIPVITLDYIKMINCGQLFPPLTDEELRVFLKFQYSVGRVLYFDKSDLDQHIILSPTFVIDAFFIIIGDKRFSEGGIRRNKPLISNSQRGIIAKKSIEDVWQKSRIATLRKHQEYLLKIMTHLFLLVEQQPFPVQAEFYFVPTMVENYDTTGYLASPTFIKRNIAFAFSPSAEIAKIPSDFAFRFITYCLSIWLVKKYGQENHQMLFHKSAVFSIYPSVDMYVTCDDNLICIRLVHEKHLYLIDRYLAYSLMKRIAVAVEHIRQLYVKTSRTGSLTYKGSFKMSLICSSPIDPCILSMSEVEEQDGSWICQKHQIEHTEHILSSWVVQKTNINCGKECPITNNEFLRQIPTDLHVRRLAMQYSITEIKELAIHLGMVHNEWDRMHDEISDTERLNFEILHRCIDRSSFTFHDIKKAVEEVEVYIRNPHTICRVVMGYPIDFDQEPEIWDMIPTDEQIERLAHVVGNNSLLLLVELGMDFHTWELIRDRQNGRDLVKLNQHILNEWRFTFCKIHNIRPSLRHIGHAFNNIGKNTKIIENVLADLW